ncbi:DMT family transporter [Candidatus Saccharibacteria bacterium]|nr:DMT family transporter [Candidatus Saccharibacteria bacterium]
MNWLILMAINVVSDSTRIFIDNYVTDYYFKGKESVSSKIFYGYAGLFFALLIGVIFGVNFSNATVSTIMLLILAGFISGIAGIPYYRALELEDSTSIGIFLQFAPVLYLIMGWFLLGEKFSPLQLVSFVLILVAPLVIVFTARKRSRHLKVKAIMYALLYVIAYVVSALIFVLEGLNGLDIISALVLVQIGKGLGNLAAGYGRVRWRKRFYTVLRKTKFRVIHPMFLNSIIGIVADFCYRYALIIAPSVALASAVSDTAEPIFIFFTGIILTLISPKVGREKLNKKAILAHMFATILVVAGVVLMQIT